MPIDDVGDAVRTLEKRLALLLRDAARDGHDRIVSVFEREHAELAQARIQLVFGVLANAARVDHDDVGVRGILGGLVAGLLEEAGHALGVVRVHLAAVGFDQVLLGHALPRHPPAGFAFAFWFHFAFRFRLSAARGEHLAGRGADAFGNPGPAKHAAHFLDSASIIEPRHGCFRTAALDVLLDPEVRVGVCRNLRQVRDAEHLERGAEDAQLPSHDVGDPPADAGVDLVEDQAGRCRARRPFDDGA